MIKKFIIILISAMLFSISFVPASLAASRHDDARQFATQSKQSERRSAAFKVADLSFQQRFSNISVPANQSIQSFNVMENSPFMTPAQGRFTSKFGWRDLGFGPEFHKGVDIANATGTNVVAAAHGTVIFSGVMGGYGNVVILKHDLNEVRYSTVYAHLHYLNVSVGQQVFQGQSIGLMGNTGRSFGSHLHFEIHLGDWNGQRSNAVDPSKYILL